jgi:hypothetical protein
MVGYCLYRPIRVVYNYAESTKNVIVHYQSVKMITK